MTPLSYHPLVLLIPRQVWDGITQQTKCDFLNFENFDWHVNHHVVMIRVHANERERFLKLLWFLLETRTPHRTIAFRSEIKEWRSPTVDYCQVTSSIAAVTPAD